MQSLSFLIISFIFYCFILSHDIEAGYIFVSNENSDTVTVLNLKTKEIIKNIDTGGRPRDLKLSNNGKLLYIVESEENQISILDISTLKIVDFIKTGDDPEIFDIHPKKNLLAVSNEDDNQLTLINLEDKTIIKTLSLIHI